MKITVLDRSRKAEQVRVDHAKHSNTPREASQMMGDSRLKGARLRLEGQNRETMLVPRPLKRLSAEITCHHPARGKGELRAPAAAKRVAGKKYP